jgi:hypothetical protein
MRNAEADVLPEDLEQMHKFELEFLEKRAAQTACSRLLEMLEVQQRIIENMMEICKKGEKI